MANKSNFKRNVMLLTALSFGAMHIINRVENTNASYKCTTRTRENKTYDWRYGKIQYIKKGYGTPLLLIHDLTLGSSKYEYEEIYSKLSKNHTVFVIDMLGYGDSDKPSMTYTASLFEELIGDFIKQVIGTKTDIIVTGSTAPIILKLAYEQNKMVGKIIAINPLGLYDQNLIPSKQTLLLKFLFEIPVLGTFIYNVNSTRNEIENKFTTEYLSDSNSMSQDKLNGYIDKYYYSAHAKGYQAKYSHLSFVSQYMTCSILHELKELNNSILILAGSKEKDIENNIENYKYYNGAIESEIIEGAAHLPQIEKPAEVCEAVEVFL